MKRLIVVSILFMLVLLTSHSLANLFEGTLLAADGGLDGTGFWITDTTGEPGWFPATLDWQVSQNQDSTWHYSYTLTVYRADVSHFLLETSIGFGNDNIFNLQFPGDGVEIATFTQQQGNPYMPGDLHGVKFDEISGTVVDISFDSNRIPVWGDFYAKCGAAGGTQNTVWNSGFLNPDPTDPAANGSIDNHILVPNSVVPEPATLFLLGLGGFAFVRKQSKQKYS